MSSLSSYSRTFDKIADKMISIVDNKKKSENKQKENKKYNTELIRKILAGEDPAGKVKLRNILKRLFGRSRNDVIKMFGVGTAYQSKLNAYSNATKEEKEAILKTPGAFELFQLLMK